MCSGSLSPRDGCLGYDWLFGQHGEPTQVAELDGTPGQGVQDPVSNFGNHYIVFWKDRYFDPSYGSGPFFSQRSWEMASLDGFKARCANPWVFPPYVTTPVARKLTSDPTALETEFCLDTCL